MVIMKADHLFYENNMQDGTDIHTQTLQLVDSTDFRGQLGYKVFFFL